MREILFRGKRIDNGKWEYGGCVSTENEVFLIYNQTHSIDLEPHTVEKRTIGQYTGLTDQNGKKIFENGYMIIDNKTYKVIFDNAEYILINIFNCDIITLKNNSIKGVFVDEI